MAILLKYMFHVQRPFTTMNHRFCGTKVWLDKKFQRSDLYANIHERLQVKVYKVY